MPSRFVKRKRLTDEVADSIREMILVGELDSSRKFTQLELAQTVGVSTMPVREALLRLSYEGLIKATPNQSYAVTKMTRSDIEDVYWLYSILAGELTARTCMKATAQLEQELIHLNDQLLKLRRGKPERIQRANWEFHRAINRAAGAPRLLHTLGATLRLIPEHFYALLPRWAQVNARGHAEILKAIKDRDPEAGRRAGSAHALEAGRIIISHFSDRDGYWRLPA